MKLTYTVATLELCLDLTRPERGSVPVGVLVLGEAGDIRLAVLGTNESPIPDLADELTCDLLRNITPVLKAKVDAAIRHTGFELTRVLERLNSSMMGSLHVGTISEQRVIEVAEVRSELMNVATRRLPETPISAHSWPLGTGPRDGALPA